jgi:outer membrane protein
MELAELFHMKTILSKVRLTRQPGPTPRRGSAAAPGPRNRSGNITRCWQRCSFAAVIGALLAPAIMEAGENGTNALAILRRPLSKAEAVNVAILHNGTILEAKRDVEAAAGVAIQTKAIIYPHVDQRAEYTAVNDSLIEQNEHPKVGPIGIELPPPIGTVKETFTRPRINNQSWYSEVVITQSIYEGGRLLSAVRTARLLNKQAWLDYESTVADTLLTVSTAYDDVLRAAMQINVRTDAVTFLRGYLHDTTSKFNAGSAPQFDVLRQTAELGNAEAERVRAIGEYRVAKQRFVELLGCNLPRTVSDDLLLNLTTPLVARSYPQTLSTSLAEAQKNRTEILALEKEERLRDEAIIDAKAGYKPSVQAFAGYELTSRVESRNAGDEVHGGLVGVRVSWAIFDGFLAKGRVDEARARRAKSAEARAETMRQVELQVRTAWSDLRTARAVLDAQIDNVRTAERSLEIAQARYNAGAGTQVDVLDAQSALTQARGQYVNALRDHSVARSRLIRATGSDLQKG